MSSRIPVSPEALLLWQEAVGVLRDNKIRKFMGLLILLRLYFYRDFSTFLQSERRHFIEEKVAEPESMIEAASSVQAYFKELHAQLGFRDNPDAILELVGASAYIKADLMAQHAKERHDEVFEYDLERFCFRVRAQFDTAQQIDYALRANLLVSFLTNLLPIISSARHRQIAGTPFHFTRREKEIIDDSVHEVELIPLAALKDRVVKELEVQIRRLQRKLHHFLIWPFTVADRVTQRKIEVLTRECRFFKHGKVNTKQYLSFQVRRLAFDPAIREHSNLLKRAAIWCRLMPPPLTATQQACLKVDEDIRLANDRFRNRQLGY